MHLGHKRTVDAGEQLPIRLVVSNDKENIRALIKDCWHNNKTCRQFSLPEMGIEYLILGLDAEKIANSGDSKTRPDIGRNWRKKHE